MWVSNFICCSYFACIYGGWDLHRKFLMVKYQNLPIFLLYYKTSHLKLSKLCCKIIKELPFSHRITNMPLFLSVLNPNPPFCLFFCQAFQLLKKKKKSLHMRGNRFNKWKCDEYILSNIINYLLIWLFFNTNALLRKYY